MDAVQVATALAGILFGGAGALLGLRRDKRDEESKRTAREKKEQERDDHLLTTMREYLMQEMRVLEANNRNVLILAESTKDAVTALNHTIETKLVTQQELALLTMRVDSNQDRISVLEKALHDTQLRCATHGHRGRDTSAIPRSV